jgi:beta-glucanase (GH16 family)
MRLFFQILTFLTTINGYTQSSQLPVKGYRLSWHDEFDGVRLDLRNWQHYALGQRRQAWNVSENALLNGKGQLLLKVTAANDTVKAAIVATDDRYSTTYGYFECRARLPDVPGAWPAFWIMSKQTIMDNGKPETHGAEIDIFEYFLHERTDAVAHTIHWGGYGKTHQIAGPVWGKLGQSKNGFHVFGLEWTPTGYKTFVDGKLTQSYNALVSKVPEFILLSIEVDNTVVGPLDRQKLPAIFEVDYVRVYKKR